MKEEENEIDQTTINFVENCIANSKNLLKAAREILNSNLPNISYHLAVLSLEEIGKAGLVAADAVSRKTSSYENIIKDKISDHTYKLFWAIWQADRSVSKLLPETFKNAQKLAQNIHQMRMASLYASEEGIHNISFDEADALIQIAEARLKIQNSASVLSKIQPESINELDWFLSATKNINMKSHIFSEESFQKFSELQHIGEWVKWNRESIEKQNLRYNKILQEELKREFPLEIEKFEPKWKVRFKLITTGPMLLSQQAFNEWNNKVNRIKFIVEGKNKKNGRLIVDLYFPKLVNIKDLYLIASQEMYRIILSLNIGTMGFFWWYNLHPFIQKFETVEDIENKMLVSIEVNNPYIDVWKSNETTLTINAKDIERIFWCYFMIPAPSEVTPDQKFYAMYLHALTFYSKHESELPMMVNSGMLFLECLNQAMIFYGDVENKNTFASKFYENFNDILQSPEDVQLFRSITEPYSNGDNETVANKMTPDVAKKMKVFCDSYLLLKFKNLIPNRMKELGSEIETSGKQ